MKKKEERPIPLILGDLLLVDFFTMGEPHVMAICGEPRWEKQNGAQ